MSVKASVASMALSGCPEAGALRCRPEMADRNLDAPQLQKLEEIVERAEEASLVQIGAKLADGWTIQSRDRTPVSWGDRGDRMRIMFQQFEDGVVDRRGHVGMLIYKPLHDNEKDRFQWGRRGPGGLEARGRLVNLADKTCQMPASVVPDGIPLSCRFNGVENHPQAEEMWRALTDGEVLAMGASDTFHEVYVAVLHDHVTKAYEFDLSAPAEEAGRRYTKVRQVHYHVNDVNGENTFHELEDGLH